MDIILLAMLALVTCAAAHLLYQQRNTQRAEQRQELRFQPQNARSNSDLQLEQLEDQMTRLVEEERRKREETAAALSDLRAAAYKLHQELDELCAGTQPALNQPLMTPERGNLEPLRIPDTVEPVVIHPASRHQLA